MGLFSRRRADGEGAGEGAHHAPKIWYDIELTGGAIDWEELYPPDEPPMTERQHAAWEQLREGILVPIMTERKLEEIPGSEPTPEEIEQRRKGGVEALGRFLAENSQQAQGEDNTQ